MAASTWAPKCTGCCGSPPSPPAAAEPKQSGSFRYLQGMLEAGEGGKTPSHFPTRIPTP